MRPPGTAPFLPDGWWELPLTRRRQIAVVVLIAVLVLAVVLIRALLGGGESSPSTSAADDDGAAAYVAALPPQEVATWDSLAECESGGEWSDDTGNGFYGGLQFTLESWETVGGSGNPAEASRDEQIMRADMLQQEQGWGAWPSCAGQLGLT